MSNYGKPIVFECPREPDSSFPLNLCDLCSMSGGYSGLHKQELAPRELVLLLNAKQDTKMKETPRFNKIT